MDDYNGGKSGIRKGKGRGRNDDNEDGECGISKCKCGNDGYDDGGRPSLVS